MRRYRHFLLTLMATLIVSLGAGAIAADSNSPVPVISPAQTQFEQGLEAYQSGQFIDAIDHWQQSLELDNDPQQQAHLLGNLAIAYYETGQYLNALETNQQAIALFTELEQVAAVGQVQSNLGNVYEALGDYNRAIEVYQESLEISRATGNRTAEGISIGNLGYLYSLQGDQSSALAAYDQSLAIAREVGDREGEGHRLLNIGIAHHALNDIATATEHYQQSLAVAREIAHPSLEARALGNLGIAVADTGEYNAAISYYQESLAIAKTLQNPELVAITLSNLGHTLKAADRLDEAEAHLRDAIANLDAIRSNLKDAYNVSVFDTQIHIYNLLTQVLVAKQEPEAALEVAEAGRARAFTDLLAQRFNAFSGSEGMTVPVTINTASSAPLSVDAMRAMAQRTHTTCVEYSLVPAEDVRFQGKQRGRTAAIQIWVISPDSDITFRESVLDDNVPPLADLVAASRDAMGLRGRGLGVIQDNENTRPKGPDKLQILHQLLIEPIQDLLPQTPEDKVVLIPQGDLFLVPFPALIDAAGDRLIQHHTLLTAPSMSVLDLTYQRRTQLRGIHTLSPESADWLIVGNPEMPEVWNPQLQMMQQLPTLQGAEQEALEVATLFNTNALIGSAASESRVKDRIETAQVVHLATHGLLEYGNVESSGIEDIPGAIALTPEADQDGLLTAAEILNELTLQADLVVLSACDTGRGDITGDGVLGLSRSLIAAGAPSVVVSLWSVPDAPTADLMITFYAALKQGKDKAQALRKAMLNTMQAYPDPQNWAAFTLIGEAQ